MPLPFPSRSHQTVAFGFFNIEIDMMLLEELFFFAEPFCNAVAALLASPRAQAGAARLPGWRMDSPAAAGNVNLAISGADLSGFIGETYRRFPFPERPEDFRQKPHAQGNRAWAEETIRRYARPLHIRMVRDLDAGIIAIGDYQFHEPSFGSLIAYVDRGGYPRWEGDLRPPYVTAMLRAMDADY